MYLKGLGFKQVNIVIFKHNVKDNECLKTWNEIKQEFGENKENYFDSKYDDDDRKPTKPHIIQLILNIIKYNKIKWILQDWVMWTTWK